MSDESAWFEVGELLGAISRVGEPDPRVLEAAREVLWSAVAREMLGLRPVDEQGITTGGSSDGREEEAERRGPRRRQTRRPPDDRKTAMGGRDPDL